MEETTTFTNPGQVAILVTAFTSLIVTLATLFYNYKREGRRQGWEVERREWEAGAAKRHADVSAAAKAEREEIAKRVEEAELALNAKIDENTEISRLAFTEANHINEKIKAQGVAFDTMLREALAIREETAVGMAEAAAVVTADKLQDAVDDTREKVSDIHERVVTIEDADAK